MGFSEMDLRCKRHPNETQQPGICSSCLREKLSLISYNNNTSACYSSYSSVSYSSAVSSSSTPRKGHHRNGSEVLSSVSFMLSGGEGDRSGLKKSKSIAFVTRGDGGKKKGGFWKKLLRNTGKRTREVLMNSRSVRNRERFDQ